MSFSIPSHSKSQNERNERRQNHKDEISRINGLKKPLLDDESAHRKFDKLARGFIAAENVRLVGTTIRIYVRGGKAFYPVYRIAGKFVCECNDRERYGFCAHEKAAEIFAARHDAETTANHQADEKPYTATLRWGNRKGLDFDRSERFLERREACEWLATESFNKFQPEGEVTDVFGSIVFEITDEFFEIWAEV